MIGSIGRRLRLTFGSSSDQALPEEDRVDVYLAEAPQIEFVAYSEDSLVSGRLRLDADRLTDLLNQHDEYLLVDALVESLTDGYAVEVKEVLVNRDELLLVHAVGPRGNAGRRQRTRPHAMALQTGPFHVRGYLHVLPGADPLLALRRRKPMVPFTDAWIEYQSGAVRQRRRVGAVVVNRELIDWIVPAVDEEVELPDLPLNAEKGPLVKDFTGQLLFADSDEGRFAV